MKPINSSLACLLGLAALSSSAHAHFRLLSPAAWIVEDDQGNPQKTGPCGTDPQSGTLTMDVTTVQAGETIMVEFEETIHHPGWFRIAIAEDRSEFTDIEFPNSDCTVDLSTVPTEPHGNVLVDGLGMDSDLFGANRKFSEMVTIPDMACENCTLQVIQVMADSVHSPPGCIYYHCADLKIVAAGEDPVAGDGSSMDEAGSDGNGAAGGDAASAAAGASGGAEAADMSAASMGAGGSGATASGTAGTSTDMASTSTPTDSGAAGEMGTNGSPASSGVGTTATAGSGTAAMTSAASSADPSTSAPATESTGGGCAVGRAHADANGLSACWVAVLGLVLWGVRRKRVAFLGSRR